MLELGQRNLVSASIAAHAQQRGSLSAGVVIEVCQALQPLNPDQFASSQCSFGGRSCMPGMQTLPSHAPQLSRRGGADRQCAGPLL
jgi:hypothetical protein